MRGSAYLSCEEEPQQAFWQRLAARLCARKHLLQLWNTVTPESDALFRVQQRGLPQHALHQLTCQLQSELQAWRNSRVQCVRANSIQHGAAEELQDELPSCCTAGKHQYMSWGLVLCLFSNAEEKATVMPLMPPMVMSTVTFPSSLPPYCFLMAFNRSCTILCGTQIKR